MVQPRLIPATLSLGLLIVAGSAGPTAQVPSQPARSGIDPSGFNREVRPQDDFFAFANGGWVTRTEIPADKSRVGSFSDLGDRVAAQLRAIAEEAARPDASPSLRKIGAFYQAFMDEGAAERAGLQPLAAELQAIDAVASQSDLTRVFVRLTRLGVRTPLTPAVFPDPDRPDTMALSIRQGGLGLPGREYYLNDEAVYAAAREQYERYVTTLLTLAGDGSAASAGRDVMAVETDLARDQWTPVQSRDRRAMHNPIKTADLESRYAGFEWPLWIRGLGVEVPVVIVNQVSYVKAVAGRTTSIPLPRWKAYLKAALLDRYAPYLSRPFVEAEFAFRGATLGGRKANLPRWRRAVDAINVSIGHAMAQAYVERHFPPASRDRMARLVENLRVALGDAIDEADWMSAPTRREARDKLRAFRANIGYPARWRDYTGLEVRADDLAGNMLRAARFEQSYQLDRVGDPSDPEEWTMLPQVVNAQYSPPRNAITFPAGILQPPFFDVTADDAVNYGAIGAVIGHEMGHGFDDQGRRSDAAGRLRDWWAPADAAEYEKRAARIAEQYDAYEALPGLFVNGKLTLGENIGDLTGVAIGLRAYHRSLEGREAPVLDGFTGDQRFFLGYAQIWRTKMRDETRRQQVLTDPHSPEQFRVRGPLVNVAGFYRAFEVKEGDGMWVAPDKRTRIW
jgi:predicted metalloendopeptidase